MEGTTASWYCPAVPVKHGRDLEVLLRYFRRGIVTGAGWRAGGVLWDSLELQSGPGTALELPEAPLTLNSSAPRTAKILFMQQPTAAAQAGDLESSLQGLLPGYPAEAPAPEPEQAAAAQEPVVLPVRLGVGSHIGGEGAGGALLRGDERTVSAASLDAQLGRKLLGSAAAPAEEQALGVSPADASAAERSAQGEQWVDGRLYGNGQDSQEWLMGGKAGVDGDAGLGEAPEEAAGQEEASQPGIVRGTTTLSLSV